MAETWWSNFQTEMMEQTPVEEPMENLKVKTTRVAVRRLWLPGGKWFWEHWWWEGLNCTNDGRCKEFIPQRRATRVEEVVTMKKQNLSEPRSITYSSDAFESWIWRRSCAGNQCVRQSMLMAAVVTQRQSGESNRCMRRAGESVRVFSFFFAKNNLWRIETSEWNAAGGRNPPKGQICGLWPV